MIYVDQAQLNQVEYLLDQAAQGNHVLFDSELLRKVFSHSSDTRFSESVSLDAAYSVEPHIEKLLSLPSLERQRAYLEKLNSETLDRVVRTYFNIVENSLYDNLSVKH